MQNFYKTIESVLKEDPRFVSEDGVLLRNAVYEAGMQMDADLLKKLLKNEETKKHFFKEIDGMFVFDKIGFGWVINNREFLPDSYTRYKNKIGLADTKGGLISAKNDIELVFPYKDCVLEGGQTKEDQKRDEIFYNEALAPNEVDRLLSPKAFTGAKRYTEEGTEKITELMPNDNLIIKGNNLLALASLLKRYEEKVKCIYIDPPYYFTKNKPTDAFKYNSNFKLSTWLVFMKDRIKMAHDLLQNEGVLFCHIGEDGFAWTKILILEIFGEENFVETFIWKNTDNADSLSKKSRSSVEYIICFEKKQNSSSSYIGKSTENGDAPLLNTGNGIHELVFPSGTIRFNIPDGHYIASKPDRVEIASSFDVENGKNKQDVILKGEFKWGQAMLNDEIKKGTYFLVKTEKFSIRFQRKEKTHMAPEKFIDFQYLSKAVGAGTNEDANTHLKNLDINFSFSKPESLISFLLNAVTKDSDIVLDFFIGSGTIPAVAHKMGLQYIGVEQMDYIEDIAVERLKKVIDGEQGGISKTVDWQGGGSFVYCELAELNQAYVNRIQEASDDKTLAKIWKEMLETGYISSKVRIKEIDPSADDFKELSIEDKKRILLATLDKNMLYVNACDCNDEEYALSDADKAFTNSFYTKGE